MDEPRYRLDDLRRFATALGTAAGVRPPRAAALASQLAWYDESGFGRFGLGTLPGWLEQMADGRVDASAEGVVTSELLGAAVLDGRNGLPPLILARASELAIEKSRDAGLGLVRVSGIASAGPTAAVVAAMASGPVVGTVLGSGGSLSLALPALDGPAAFDSALGEAPAALLGDPAADGHEAVATAAGPWAPWLWAMVPDCGYLVAAIAVKAVEPLTTIHERVGAMIRSARGGAGQVIPTLHEPLRREAREHGVVVTTETLTRLREWAARLGVAVPPPAQETAHAPGGTR